MGTRPGIMGTRPGSRAKKNWEKIYISGLLGKTNKVRKKTLCGIQDMTHILDPTKGFRSSSFPLPKKPRDKKPRKKIVLLHKSK